MNRFPRAQRTLLGRVIPEDALQTMVLLTVANRRTQKGETLAEASGRLDALRITLRLSQRLGLLSHGGYARVSGVLDGSQHAHAVATPSTSQHVHPERVPHQLRPRPLSRRRRWGLLHAPVVVGGDVDVRMQVEAVEVCLPAARGRHPGCAWDALDLPAPVPRHAAPGHCGPGPPHS
jgi:hypothetical protein